jgi:hypothetical protein
VPVLLKASVNDNTPGAATESVSCPSAGNCAAVGAYLDKTGRIQAFVIGQRGGTWGKEAEMPGTGALNAGGDAQAISVSCRSAGNCSSGGFYTGPKGRGQAFVVSERNGRWAEAVELPGMGKLNVRGNAALVSLSCPAAGRCGGGGDYRGKGGLFQAFVVSQAGH